MIMTLRDLGLVSQVFDEEKLQGLAGTMAIGHVRYSTTGGGAWENTQPVWRDDGREVALAHNGNLTNAVELYAELRERGISFRGTSDSEIIAALLSSSPEKRIEDAVVETMPRLEGAYSTVVMTKSGICAFRDPQRRPAAGARPARAPTSSSPPRAARSTSSAPSCCARSTRARWSRSASAGSRCARRSSRSGSRSASSSTSTSPVPTAGSRAGSCSRSAAGWARSSGARRRSTPTSSSRSPTPATRRPSGFSRASGLPKDDGLIKNRYVARTFIQPGPGAAQARPADEVQPAARDRRRQAARRRRRLDRPRQHDPPDRRDAPRRRRARGPPADLGAADPLPLPLRRRHVEPRGDGRPRADRSTRSPSTSAPTRSPTCRSTASTRRSGRRPRTTATPASPAATRSARTRTASSRSSS